MDRQIQKLEEIELISKSIRLTSLYIETLLFELIFTSLWAFLQFKKQKCLSIVDFLI